MKSLFSSTSSLLMVLSLLSFLNFSQVRYFFMERGQQKCFKDELVKNSVSIIKIRYDFIITKTHEISNQLTYIFRELRHVLEF